MDTVNVPGVDGVHLYHTVRRLSGSELSRPVSPDWNVAATLEVVKVVPVVIVTRLTGRQTQRESSRHRSCTLPIQAPAAQYATSTSTSTHSARLSLGGGAARLGVREGVMLGDGAGEHTGASGATCQRGNRVRRRRCGRVSGNADPRKTYIVWEGGYST